MKLPKRLQIGPFSYRVLASEHILNDEGRALNGAILYQSLEIHIDPTQKPQRQRETLTHELVHAITHDRKLDLDEQFVHSFSMGLSAALTNNPDLVKLYLKDVT